MKVGYRKPIKNSFIPLLLIFALSIFYTKVISSTPEFYVISVTPKYYNGTLDKVFIKFSQPPDPSSIQTAIMLIDETANPVDYTFWISQSSPTTVVLLPSTHMFGNFTLIISSALLRSEYGNTLEKDYVEEIASPVKLPKHFFSKISHYPSVYEEITSPIINGQITFDEPLSSAEVIFISNNKRIKGEYKINGKVIVWRCKTRFNLRVVVNRLTKSKSGAFLQKSVILDYSLFDTTPPKIIKTSPAPNSQNIPINPKIFAIFSEKIKAEKGAVLFIENSKSTKEVNFKVENKAIILDTGILKSSSNYTVLIRGNKIKDLAGNKMGYNFSWSFSTKQTWHGRILNVSPKPTETLPLKPTIMIFLSKPPLSMTSLDKYVQLKNQNQNVPLSVTWVKSLSAIVIKPLVTLAPDTDYTLLLDLKPITGDLKIMKFHWKTERVENKTPLKVIAFSPTGTLRANSFTISICFNKRLNFFIPKDAATVTLANGLKVPGRWVIEKNCLKFYPYDYKEGRYRVDIKPVIQARDFTMLDHAISWSFNFLKILEKTFVVEFSPTNESKVFPGFECHITFNKPVVLSAVSKLVSVVRNETELVRFKVEQPEDRTIAIKFDQKPGKYTISIDAGFIAYDSSRFDGFKYSFTVKKRKPPQIPQVIAVYPKVLRSKLFVKLSTSVIAESVNPITVRLTTDKNEPIKCDIQFVDPRLIEIIPLNPIYSKYVKLTISGLVSTTGGKMQHPFFKVIENRMYEKLPIKLLSFYPVGKVLKPVQAKFAFSRKFKSLKVIVNGVEYKFYNRKAVNFSIDDVVLEGDNVIVLKWTNESGQEYTKSWHFTVISPLKVVRVIPKEGTLLPQYSKVVFVFSNPVETIDSVKVQTDNFDINVDKKNINISYAIVSIKLPMIKFGGEANIIMENIKDKYGQTLKEAKASFNVIEPVNIISLHPTGRVESASRIIVKFRETPRDIHLKVNGSPITDFYLWNEVLTAEDVKFNPGKNVISLSWIRKAKKENYKWQVWIGRKLKLLSIIPKSRKCDIGGELIISFNDKIKRFESARLITREGVEDANIEINGNNLILHLPEDYVGSFVLTVDTIMSESHYVLPHLKVAGRTVEPNFKIEKIEISKSTAENSFPVSLTVHLLSNNANLFEKLKPVNITSLDSEEIPEFRIIATDEKTAIIRVNSLKFKYRIKWAGEKYKLWREVK